MIEEHTDSDVVITLDRPHLGETDALLGSHDLSVEDYGHLNDEALDALLSLSDGNPAMFNPTRYVDASRNLWDYPNLHENHVNLSLLWHQKVGVATLVEHFWAPKDIGHGHQTGMILADEVGVGKTAQLMAFLAFLLERVMSKAIPPIIRKHISINPFSNSIIIYEIIGQRPFWGGCHLEYPMYPSLIIIPGTLIDQWHRELKIFFKPKTIEIFRYPTSWERMQQFWLVKSPFQTSRLPPSHRVVLMAHSVSDCSSNGDQLNAENKSTGPFNRNQNVVGLHCEEGPV